MEEGDLGDGAVQPPLFIDRQSDWITQSRSGHVTQSPRSWSWLILVDRSEKSVKSASVSFLKNRHFVCVSKFPSSYEDTSHTGFRAYHNLVWPHLDLITCAKTLVPHELTFTGYESIMNQGTLSLTHSSACLEKVITGSHTDKLVIIIIGRILWKYKE